MDQPKGFLQSAIVLNSVVAGVLGIVIAAIDPIASLAKTAMPQHAKSIDDIASIVRIIGVSGVVGGTNGAIANRTAKGDIYTPRWAPGPNKADLVDAEPVNRGGDRVADTKNYAPTPIPAPIPTPIDDIATTIAAASRLMRGKSPL